MAKHRYETGTYDDMQAIADRLNDRELRGVELVAIDVSRRPIVVLWKMDT